MTSTFGQRVAVGIDLFPGEEQSWIVFGDPVQNGNTVFSFMAEPFFGLPWELIFEVTHVSSEVDAQGGRRIFVTVRNSSPPSSDFGSYSLFVTWTDLLPL